MGAFDYQERRYYNLEESLEYSELVKTLTTVSGSNRTLIPQTLIDMFSLTKFNEAVLTDTKSINVPNSVFSEPGIHFNSDDFFKSLIDDAANNGPLKTYYNSVDSIDDTGSETLIAFIKSTAKLVIQFYTFSSILYASMYKGSTLGKPPFIDNIVLPARSVANTVNSSSIYPNGPYAALYDRVEGDTESYRLTKLVKAIFQIEEQMNVKNELELSMVNTNIELNNDFENNDLIIKDKENVFNKEKSYVITMMSKNKRITKQYNRKWWLFIIYLIIFLFYIFSMASLYYAGSSGVISSLNANLVGNIMVGLNASALLAIILYYVLRYLFKNKFFF